MRTALSGIYLAFACCWMSNLWRIRAPATIARGLRNSFIIASSPPWRAKETMPTYHVEMLEGRSIEQKKKLAEAITRVSVEILGGQPDSVDIIISDIKRENWATGGKLWSEPGH